jgi:hypothetical protein
MGVVLFGLRVLILGHLPAENGYEFSHVQLATRLLTWKTEVWL